MLDLRAHRRTPGYQFYEPTHGQGSTNEVFVAESCAGTTRFNSSTCTFDQVTTCSDTAAEQPEIDRIYYYESLASGSYRSDREPIYMTSVGGRRPLTTDDLIRLAGEGWTPEGQVRTQGQREEAAEVRAARKKVEAEIARAAKDPADARAQLMETAWPASDVEPLIQLIDEPRAVVEAIFDYHEKRGFFGFFESIDDTEVSNALFDAALSSHGNARSLASWPSAWSRRRTRRSPSRSSWARSSPSASSTASASRGCSKASAGTAPG